MSKELGYSQIATDIVQFVGGQENIRTLGHCMTRLRFVLIDEGRVGANTIRKVDWAYVLYRSVANLLSLWKKSFARPHGSNQKYNINKENL